MTSAGGDSPTKADRVRVQRAALGVALSVGLGSIALIGVITAATVTLIFTGSRPDRGPRPGGGRGPGRVVDVGDLVPLVIGLGVLGVIVLSLIAWYASQRAARPLAEALRVQRAFVADASHELRTPLTTLTSRIQLAQHRLDRGGDVRPVLSDLRRDADAMDAVLTDLLLASQTAGTGAHDRDAVASVAAVAAEATGMLRPRADEAGVHLAVDVPPSLEVAADPAALTRALVALLDNAVRHSPPAGTVTVSARRVGRRAEIRVADQGSGIRGVDPERIFERFVRAEDPTASRGFGLGLALVCDIAVRFGGSVRVEQTSETGTTLLLVLPTARHDAG